MPFSKDDLVLVKNIPDTIWTIVGHVSETPSINPTKDKIEGVYLIYHSDYGRREEHEDNLVLVNTPNL